MGGGCKRHRANGHTGDAAAVDGLSEAMDSMNVRGRARSVPEGKDGSERDG
jgi:hypothetical protein